MNNINPTRRFEWKKYRKRIAEAEIGNAETEAKKIVEDAVMENPKITKEECIKLLKTLKNVE